MPRRNDIVARAHVHRVISDIRAANAQVALRIVFIAHSAALMADAIVRSLYRTLVSRKLSAEWRTAAQADSAARGGILAHYKSMWQAPALAALSVALAMISDTGLPYIGIPFALVWALSPMTGLVCQPGQPRPRTSSSFPIMLQTELRRSPVAPGATSKSSSRPNSTTCRRTISRRRRKPALAERTSPTNIGVYLLSVISARDFGWISFEETVRRLEQTIATIDGMPKYRGHLYNWYRTNTLETLGPRYVSAVDSGNLAGHLIAVSSEGAATRKPSAHLQGQPRRWSATSPRSSPKR